MAGIILMEMIIGTSIIFYHRISFAAWTCKKEEYKQAKSPPRTEIVFSCTTSEPTGARWWDGSMQDNLDQDHVTQTTPVV